MQNSADLSTFPVLEPGMDLVESDGKNIVCASDTYFNPFSQECTRSPFPDDVSIVYLVTNDPQHGHQMVITSSAKSAMFLQGERFQPKVRTEWDLPNDKTAYARFIQDATRSSQNFAPSLMGDFKKYDFRLELVDSDKHNFFLAVGQAVFPRKCVYLEDRSE